MSPLRMSKRVYIGIGLFLLLASVPIVLLARPSLVTIALQPWKDWSEIGYYHEDNARFIASPDPERVVFFGDSHIGGWHLYEYFPGKPYVNRGIGGQTTAQMLVRFREDVIDLKPRLVLILGGSNDVLIHLRKLPFEQTVENYASMGDLAREHNIKVIFAAVPPVNDYRSEKWTARLEQPDGIQKLNEWLRNYCAANGFIFLDYYDQVLDEKGMMKPELSDDGEHFNGEGYKLVSRLAEAAIQSTRTRPAKD
jgi:lysophospholipase L1-like esterase